MLYRMVVHVPVPEGDEAVILERVRSTLAEEDVEVERLDVHDSDMPGLRLIHLESLHEAPSAYHAAHISGKDLFNRALEASRLGFVPERIDIVADRVTE